MLKGSMKIELQDVNTGETETILAQNMVTNALSEIFKPIGLSKSPERLEKLLCPYYEHLLGGILLFDSSITENINTFYPPANSKLIGCGVFGEQNNTTGTYRGNYNLIESQLNLDERYMKYVYDFNANQGNGNISSVCLTSKNAGYTSYGSSDAEFILSKPLGLKIDAGELAYIGSEQTGGKTIDTNNTIVVGESEVIFLVDKENDHIYYFKINNNKSISIIKRKGYLKSISVLEDISKIKPKIEEVVLTELTTTIYTKYFSFNFDTGQNALYIFSSNYYYIGKNEKIDAIKINFGTWEITRIEIINTTDIRLKTDKSRFAFENNGFVYMSSYNSPYEVYKIEISNQANIKIIARNPTFEINGRPQLAINNRIYYEGSQTMTASKQLYVLNEATEEFLKSESCSIASTGNYKTYTPVLNNPMMFYSSCGTYEIDGFIIMGNYLATINNLQNPVTKTADKIMKVTYIIQEESNA
ncbi:MAG: hypothetical protein RSE61_05425 [Anaerovoracaceae bacterium]